MAADLLYDEAHMQSIIDGYALCADETDDMIQELTKAHTLLAANYEGQGKEISEDILDKLEEHLVLLRICCSSLGEYVGLALEDLQQADNA